jgi:hypothetical protein
MWHLEHPLGVQTNLFSPALLLPTTTLWSSKLCNKQWMISSRDTAASNKRTLFSTHHILPTLSSTNQVEIRHAPCPSFAQDEQETAHRAAKINLMRAWHSSNVVPQFKMSWTILCSNPGSFVKREPKYHCKGSSIQSMPTWQLAKCQEPEGEGTCNCWGPWLQSATTHCHTPVERKRGPRGSDPSSYS